MWGATGVSADWLLCGWRVRSELALSDLPFWSGDNRAPDLTITLGSIPPWPEAGMIRGSRVQCGRGGYRLCIPTLATFFVDASGKNIVVDLHPEHTASRFDVQDFLLGTVLVVLCQCRGLWPLHTSCVRIGDKAVAFTGPSGAGKSTLATAFLARGYEILSDDVTVIDITPEGRAMVLPSVPRIKLWRNTALDIGLPLASDASPAGAKERLPLGAGFALVSQPLASLYYLAALPQGSASRIQPLRGMDAVHETSRAAHRRRLQIGMSGGQSDFLGGIMKVAAAIPAHRRLERPLDLSALSDLVDLIVAREECDCD